MKKPSFRERYEELRMLGYRDVDMPRRLGVKYGSLKRMMQREGIAPSLLLSELANEEKQREKERAS